MPSSVFGLLLLSAVLFTGTECLDPCCSFVANNCHWSSTTDLKDNYQWTWSGDDQPTLVGINDFETTRNSGYMFLQDIALIDYINATAKSNNFVLYENDEISIDVYRHVTNPDGGPRPVLYFHDDTHGGTTFALEADYDIGWSTNKFVCGTVLPCCTQYPCTGHLEVVGALLERGELLAFDNIGLNGQCIDPEAPTCCRFQSGSPCTGWTIGAGWHSSADRQPNWAYTKQEMTHTSDYQWAQDVDGVLVNSELITGITDSSIITFQYYGDVSGSSTYSYMSVSFEVDSVSYPLTVLGDSGLQWTYYSIDCAIATCCGTADKCNGKLLFRLYHSSSTDHILVAIDDVQTAGGCGDPECCTFSTSDFCGWTDKSAALPWQWSAISSPDPAYLSGAFVPISGYYSWLQVKGGDALPDSTLVSPDIIDVDSTFYFSVQFYVELSEEISTNALNVYFQEDDVIGRVLLTTLYETKGSWSSESFSCSNVVGGSCCAGGPTFVCNGHLEIDASEATGTAFYAIDNLDMNGQCA